jgi:hypothetical protein
VRKTDESLFSALMCSDCNLSVLGCDRFESEWKCCVSLKDLHCKSRVRPEAASPKCAFVPSRARDGFSGSAPSWVRLRSHLRGRFQATKGPDVAWGTSVLSRVRECLNCYFLSRRGTSGLTPAQDTTLKKLHNGGNTRRNRAQDELNRHVA